MVLLYFIHLWSSNGHQKMEVNIQYKKLKNNYHMYLDYYYKNERIREFLKLYVSKDYSKTKDRKTTNDKEILDIVDRIKIERQKQISLESLDLDFLNKKNCQY